MRIKVEKTITRHLDSEEDVLFFTQDDLHGIVILKSDSSDEEVWLFDVKHIDALEKLASCLRTEREKQRCLSPSD